MVRFKYDVGNAPKISVDVTAPTFDHIDKSMPQILHSISAYCKELSKEHSQKPKRGSCYRHALFWKDDFLGCINCDLVLHKACTKLPLRIKYHNLSFNLGKYENDNDKVNCDCCNELVKDYAYVYISPKDNHFICFGLNCLFTPLEPGINQHEHPLYLDFRFDPLKCNACGSTRKHLLSYRCEYCDFEVGVKCGWPKETVIFDRLRHPFHLIVSPEHVSNQYYCEVCREERDKDHWVYCCIDCDYFIHVRYISLPESSFCPMPC